MPRKAHIVKREIVADPIYASSLISKFVNCMMWGGKKSTAQQILYGRWRSSEEDGRRSDQALQEGGRERQAGA
jgi:small subunit ribosomal protein S7